jgi:hypothetical protein
MTAFVALIYMSFPVYCYLAGLVGQTGESAMWKLGEWKYEAY